MNKKLDKFLNKINYSNPSELNYKCIDKRIRKTILNFNKSKICRTLWSCQGHLYNDGSEALPYIIFIVKNNYIDYFLHNIFGTLPKYKSVEFPIAPSQNFQISKGYSDKNFTIICLHWSSNYLHSNGTMKELYRALFSISRKFKKHGK